VRARSVSAPAPSFGGSPLPRLAGLDGASLAHSPDTTPLLGVVLLLMLIVVTINPTITRCFFSAARSESAFVDLKQGPHVLVSEDGRFFVPAWNGALTDDHLTAALARERTLHPGEVLFVDADRRTPYSRILDLLSGARSAGFRRVGLLAERGSPASQRWTYAAQ
jgi:biopolymer transport protein ExbD